MERKSRQSALMGMMVACMLLVVSALVFIYQANHSPETASGAVKMAVQRTTATTEDMKRLWEWTDVELQGGAAAGSWHVRLDAEGVTKEQLKTVAQQLGIKWTEGQKGIEGSDPANDNTDAPGSVWQGQIQQDDGTISLWGESSKDASGIITMVIRYDIEHNVREKELITVTGSLLRALTDNELQGKLSFNVHGYSLRDDSGERLAALAKATAKDNYKDRNTRSTTWFTPLLNASVELANSQQGNLQIAVHQQTGAGMAGKDLIAGVPLITGDYSENGG